MKVGFFLILLALCSTHVQAQALSDIQVAAFYSENAEDRQVEEEVVHHLQEHLRSPGRSQRGKSQTVLLVDARWLAYTEEVFLSVSVLQALPQEVLDLGASEEVFYLAMEKGTTPTHLPDEAREVRQQMSRDWLAQFQQVVGQHLLIFRREKMADELDALIRAITDG